MENLKNKFKKIVKKPILKYGLPALVSFAMFGGCGNVSKLEDQNGFEIKFTENGFEQYNQKGMLVRKVERSNYMEKIMDYNQGMLVRKVEETETGRKKITNYEHNDKNQLIMSAEHQINYSGPRLDSDSILYEYNDKNQLIKQINYDRISDIKCTSSFNYNDKGLLREEKRICQDKEEKVKWTEALHYKYNKKGELIRKKWINKNGGKGIKYDIYEKNGKKVYYDRDSDGKIDEVHKVKKGDALYNYY